MDANNLSADDIWRRVVFLLDFTQKVYCCVF